MAHLESKLTQSDIEKIVGEPVTSFSTTSGAKKGDNVAGSLLAIKVIRKLNPEEPLHLVYKSFPPIESEEQRQYVKEFGIFRTETCMYEKIFPRIQQLMNMHPKLENKSFPTVKYISGLNDDENDYVCLEDLRPQGFIMQDKYHTLTVAEVSLVMKEMARFHALTNFLIRYDGERMFEDDEQIRRIKYHVFNNENQIMKEMFSRMFKSYIDSTVELLEPRDKDLAEHVRNFASQSDHNRLRRLQRFNLEKTDVDMFPCILHGDLWTNNILFKYAQSGNRDSVQELKFIDFQLSRRGCIFEDLGYFFWTSTTPEFRKQHLTTMLSIYYDSFVRIYKELEYPKPVGFTKGSLIDGFTEGILSFYCYMPFALSLQMGDATLDKKDLPEYANANPDSKTDTSAPFPEVVSGGEGGAPPQMDFTQMIEVDKKVWMLRMKSSKEALDRLEDLTREIVELDLLK